MADNPESVRLLRTKLYRPRVMGDLVHRSRLCDFLDRDLDRAATLISAPAGFGKTTLLSDWLAHCDRPNTWLSLDDRDGDPAVFLSYLVAAVRKLFPSACAGTLALLRAPFLPPSDALATILVDDLDRLTDAASLPPGWRFILVLDDYHLLRGHPVDTLLSELVGRRARTMHLVLSTRQEPLFPLRELCGPDGLTEVGPEELRFTADEAAAFVQQALGAPLAADAQAALTERTEGWGAGLRLASLSLSTGGDVHVSPESANDDRLAMDYLLNEVLAHLPRATQDFLARTAFLERLCGSLCDALTRPSGTDWDGRAFLEWLARENIFTFSLDDQGMWYRYHHVFRQLLRKRLEREVTLGELAELHRRASAWFIEDGLIEEALQHAAAAGDENSLVRIVEEHRQEVMNEGDWRRLEHWLSLVQPSVIDARPELLLAEAWTLVNQWRHEALPRYLDRIEVLMDQAAPPEPGRTFLHGELDALRSLHYYYTLDSERCLAHATRALQAIPLESSFLRGIAWHYHNVVRRFNGDAQGAIAGDLEALEEVGQDGNAFPTRLYMGIGLGYWMNADLPKLLMFATEMLELGLERDRMEAIGWARYFLGCVHYQTNDLVAAEREFRAVIDQRYAVHGGAYSQSVFGLASILLAPGAADDARALLDSLEGYARGMSNVRILADLPAFRAYVALQAGAAAEAQRWARSYDLNTRPVPMTTFDVPLALRARILLDEGTSESLAEAARTLVRLRDRAEPTHNTRFLIEALALQALVDDAPGSPLAALENLRQAVALAEPGGMLRVFLDVGPKMGALLVKLSPARQRSEYLSRLLSAFREMEQPPLMADQQQLVEPLTERELQVLGLLRERLTNKEIARSLYLSSDTIKRYTVDIYGKLAVSGRREAVARARELGLLPPENRTAGVGPRSRGPG